MRWLIVLVALLSVWGARLTAWAWRRDGLAFERWSLSDAPLPFLLRFSLDGAVTAALVAGPLVLLGFASLRPRFAPAIVALVCLLCFGGAALTAGGLQQARTAAAFPPAPLHVPCGCPTTVEPAGALECHCAPDGALVVRLVAGRQLPQVAGRLGDPLVIRETFSREGLTFSREGGAASVRCSFDQPCSQRTECGRCRFEELVRFSPLTDVHCVDQQEGRGTLSGVIRLRRTVWEAESDDTSGMGQLDESAAAFSPRSILVGTEGALRATGDNDLVEMVFGRRPMRRQGVRTCVLPTGRSLTLTGDFEPPLKTRWALVRLEEVE